MKLTAVLTGYFNSRPHKEVDSDCDCVRFFPLYFNSRPHKEVDYKKDNKKSKTFISIHDLTRRSTCIFVD